MILNTRDWYCGQCGRGRGKKGEPFDFQPCNCSEGRLVTGVNYCVFCGDAYIEPHACHSHDLRDFWIRGQAKVPQGAQHRPKTHSTEQPTLIDQNNEIWSQ